MSGEINLSNNLIQNETYLKQPAVKSSPPPADKPSQSEASLQTEETISVNTTASDKTNLVSQNTNTAAHALFANQEILDEVIKEHPPEQVRANNFPPDASLDIVLKTLKSLHTVLDTQKLEENPQKLIELLRNHPEYTTELREKLSELYSPDDVIQIYMSIADAAVKQEKTTEKEEPQEFKPLGRAFRASRDGLQPASAMMAFGKTGWLDNSGIDEASDALAVLANFSTMINIKKWEGEIVSGEVGLTAGGNLEFATVDGVAYAFTHFDGTFGPTGSVSVKLSDNNILKLSGEILHESTHLGDNAMQEGMHRHNDSAEWVGGEVSFQHLGSAVEFEIYGAIDKYFHSMKQQPLNYKVETGATVSALDRKLSLSGTVDVLNAGPSSAPQVVGDIEGNHVGGRVKFLFSPAGNGTGLTVAYDFGEDYFGQNLGQMNNRVLVGFQAQDHLADLFTKRK